VKALGAAFVVVGAELSPERPRPVLSLDLGESLLERFPWLDEERTDASARVAAACVAALDEQLVDALTALVAAFRASPRPVRLELSRTSLPALRATHAALAKLIAHLEGELVLPPVTQH
jgi:hypothetical protein